MARIFISYRRDDTSGHAGRLFDDLSAQFGVDHVFMDVDALEPGEDFIQKIEDSVGTSDVLLAIIGRQWLDSSRGAQRRLHDPHDFVRMEIAAALKNGIRVIPILVQGATAPASDDLPADIAGLARRQAHELSDSRWRYDVERLIRVLERISRVGEVPETQEVATVVPPAVASQAPAASKTVVRTEQGAPPPPGDTSSLSVSRDNHTWADLTALVGPLALAYLGWYLGAGTAGAILRDSADWSEILTTEWGVHLVPARLVGGLFGGAIGGLVGTLAFARSMKTWTVSWIPLVLVAVGVALGGPATGAIVSSSFEWGGWNDTITLMATLGGAIGCLIALAAATRPFTLDASRDLPLAALVALTWFLSLWVARFIAEKLDYGVGTSLGYALGGALGGAILGLTLWRMGTRELRTHSRSLAIALACGLIVAGAAWRMGEEFGHSSVDIIPRWVWPAAGLGVALWLALARGLLHLPAGHAAFTRGGAPSPEQVQDS